MKCTLDNVVMWLIPIYAVAFPRLNIKSFGSKIIIIYARAANLPPSLDDYLNSKARQ